MRVGVVAAGDEEAAVRAEGERARVVTALLALLLVGEDHLLCLCVEDVPHQLEAAHVLADEVRRRILQVDPVVLLEVRVQGQADEPVLLLGEDLDLEGEAELGAVGVVHPELSRELDDEHASVRQDRELQRPVEALVQHALLQAVLLEDRVLGSLKRRGRERQGEGEADRHGA